MTGGTVRNLLAEGARKLASAGIEDARRDARLLLAHVLGMDQTSIIAGDSEAVDPEAARRFAALLARREDGEPVHRIIGKREFMGREFLTGPSVLEPRPETELLVERVLEDWQGESAPHFADIGTGSGAIAISLLLAIGRARCLASDISREALQVATSNASRLGVSARMELAQADLLPDVGPVFDFVVSNPPYIPAGDIAGLQREVREHDPECALDGGEDGLDFYRRLLDILPGRIMPGGRLYLETGDGQHAKIGEIAGQLGWGIVSTHLDLSGRERIVVLEVCS